MPGQRDRLVHGGATIERDQFHRQHDEKDVREEADRVDAVGEGRAIVASFSDAQAIGEPTIIDVADDEAQGDGRKDAPVDECRRIVQQPPAEPHDEENLNEVVERQPEQAVNILPHEPAGAWRRIGVVTVCFEHRAGVQYANRRLLTSFRLVPPERTHVSLLQLALAARLC